MKMSETVLKTNYMKHDALGGKPKAYTINDVRQVPMGQPGEQELKAVVYLDQDTRGLVLNKTNAGVLVDNFGDDTEAWIGEVVVLYPDRASFGGKVYDVIRVRMPKKTEPAASTEPAAPTPGDDMSDEIPF
jgi:hypothetical protein